MLWVRVPPAAPGAYGVEVFAYWTVNPGVGVQFPLCAPVYVVIFLRFQVNISYDS